MSKSKNALKAGSKRINMSIPVDMYVDILYVASRLGVSASSLFYQIAKDSVHHMASVLRQVPVTGVSDEVKKRLRGDSVAFIEGQYNDLMKDLKGDGHESAH